MCEYLNSNGQHVVVCVWGGSVSHGGALSVITISDWVRAKVCDISQLSTHSVAVETHLGVTLSSPSSLRLSSPSLPPLIRRFPWRFGAVVFHMQGANRLDGYCSSVTSTPPPHTHTHNHLLLPEPLSALFLRSSSTLSPSSPFFLVSSSRSLLLPSHLFSVSLLRGCI